MSSDDYIILDEDNNICTFLIEEIDEGTYEYPAVVLGVPFFKEKYIIFDFDNF